MAKETRQQNSKDVIFTVLFERITKQFYAPKQYLREQELSEEFKTSRTPIREVLRQLAGLGLVRIVPRKGTEVVGLTNDDVRELYEIRKTLELLALESALPFLRLQDLSDLRMRIDSTTPESPLEEIVALDIDIHNYIAQSSHMRRLQEMLAQLFKLSQRFRTKALLDPQGIMRSNREHLELVNALFRKDLEAAKAILADHIEKSKNVAITQLFEGNV